MRSSIKGLLGLALISLSLSAANAQLVTANNSTLLPGWSYLNCYSDATNNRALQGSAYQDGSNMTNENCVSYCNNGGYKYAGIEYSAECYCGNTFQGGSTVATDGRCNMACNGNSSEVCGGPYGLTVFSRSGGPIINPGLNNYGSLGCYNDTGAARTLRFGMAVPGGAANMSTYNCVSACSAQNYTYAGTEYSQECYCDNVISNYGAPAPDGSTGCNMLCNGNSKEFCGGPNRLNVYEFGAPIVTGTSTTTTTSATSTSTSTTTGTTTGTSTSTPTGSSTSITTSKTTSQSSRVPISTTSASKTSTTKSTTKSTTTTTSKTSTTLSTSKISTTVKTSSTTKASTSSTVISTPKSSTLTTTVISSSTSSSVTSTTITSSTVSSVNSTTITSTSSASSSSSTSSLSSSSVSSTTSVLSASSTVPSGWSYQGCWTDMKNGRILPTGFPDSNTLTHTSCITQCQSAGYTVAGMEYSTQCFCGNQIIQGGALSPNDSDCAMTCSGDNTTICGGPNLMTIYSIGNVTAIAPPVQQNATLPGNWQYVGCLTDVAGGTRTFPWQQVLTKNNSAQTCLSLCSNFGYGRAGMEYGDECYCGDLSDVQASGATIAPDSDCNMPCSGNASYFCGGPNRLSYYAWNGTGLPQWTYASGTAAGAYQFLIGGVTIPLVTSANVNGKVTYVEKHGTGVNGTGAYELDLAQINNFNAAWRTMNGLKTDVFCSAGLILPDRAGRQINIGGWSVNSLYGVRLYTPDGSPGNPSVNDWQENVNEVALQVGRWYPSALLLTNGSILVVGGEDGSNGAPVPSLEILPKPAGGTTLFMDWLNRTDPLNLYPFLSVLPSGNVFVAYYNEARILDPVTFATIKTLPNIPGQVNNNVSGRTYPLEGTAVLLPQYAPYSAPLSVMICGGANQGAAVGIDNCVTTQPEVANPTWAIERMPSKRVMSCIASLPDGTYLIVNGAHLGTAGFGLATDPNVNAVLYDPSRPFNQRMTVMANTTVARLYHSEATLLQDGRVLISGSDPEDPRYPQEYRNEVFVPPYLLSGAARPSFTIATSQKDWSYGGSYTITNVNLPSGAGTKISLTGGVVSTHGNSMGQRILFPAFSCSGSSCTISAPPSIGIAPPGWYMLWVLDGPTPSLSTWVRIGGDPGALGSWPAYSDFTVPGMGPIVNTTV